MSGAWSGGELDRFTDGSGIGVDRQELQVRVVDHVGKIAGRIRKHVANRKIDLGFRVQRCSDVKRVWNGLLRAVVVRDDKVQRDGVAVGCRGTNRNLKIRRG